MLLIVLMCFCGISKYLNAKTSSRILFHACEQISVYFLKIIKRDKFINYSILIVFVYYIQINFNKQITLSTVINYLTVIFLTLLLRWH